MPRNVPAAAILDIDGTLVDTNYQHAIAWYRAFKRHDIVLPVWRIHRHIGMGGDKIVVALAGEEVEDGHGDQIREAEKQLYADLIGEVEPMDGARELIEQLRRAGSRVVLASSAKQEEVDRYIELLDAAELVDGWTTSADVEATKPDPDLVHAALDKLNGDQAVMVGDTPWDVKAARAAGVDTIAVLTGGFAAAELNKAGAVAIFESVRELCERLGETPLGD
jgi:HAD superfamily hydrolase (TIGR01509 family)